MLSLDEVLKVVSPDTSPRSRQAVALGLIARASWPFAESREAWRSRFGRLDSAIRDGRFACCFDRVGRVVGGATWHDDITSGGIRLSDFWARVGGASAVAGVLRSRIGAPLPTIVYQRRVHNVPRERQHRARGQAMTRNRQAHPVEPASMTDRQDLLDTCADLLAQAREHGEILSVLARSPAYAALPTSAVLHLATLWSGLHQYRLYRDEAGDPSGLLAWAWLSDRTIADLPRAPLHRLPFSEWNEGERLCLSDIVVSPATRRAMAADIADGLFPDEPELLTYQYANAKVGVTAWQRSDRPRLAQLATPVPQQASAT